MMFQPLLALRCLKSDGRFWQSAQVFWNRSTYYLYFLSVCLPVVFYIGFLYANNQSFGPPSQLYTCIMYTYEKLNKSNKKQYLIFLNSNSNVS